MSIYDPQAFFDSEFAETATYLPFEAAAIPDITVIIDWGELQQGSLKNSQVGSAVRKNTVEFYKSDIAAVNEKKDRITVTGVKGTSETHVIKEIVYQDEFIWRVAI